MSMERREVLKILPAIASGVLAGSTHLSASGVTLHLEPSGQDSYKPLQEVTLQGAPTGIILVTDGASNPYVQEKARDHPFAFKIGGVLGIHSVQALRRISLDGNLRRNAISISSAEACLEQRECHVACVLTRGRLDCSRFLSRIAAVTAMSTAAAIASNHPECRPRCRRPTTKRRP